MSSPGLKAIEVTFNKCLRRIWGLPPRTHTGILHSCAGFQSIYNTVFSRSHNFIQRAGRSNNSLVKAVFNDILAYTFAGHNILIGSRYKKNYSSDDQECAGVLRSFILSSIDSDVVYGSSPIDSMLRTIATA